MPPESRRARGEWGRAAPWIFAAFVTTGAGGCEQLFGSPSSETDPPDLAALDSGADLGVGVLAGAVCVLEDFREPSSCKQQVTGKLRVALEGSDLLAITDNGGNFALQLPAGLVSEKLLIVTDPSGALVTSATRIAAGSGDLTRLALPTVSSTTLTIALSSQGLSLEPSRGAVILWATDASAAPQPGVRGPGAQGGAFGPYYDGVLPNQLDNIGPTRFRGLVAYFNLPAGQATIPLEPPSTATVRSDAFALPVRSGAITFTLAPLPPR